MIFSSVQILHDPMKVAASLFSKQFPSKNQRFSFKGACHWRAWILYFGNDIDLIQKCLVVFLLIDKFQLLDFWVELLTLASKPLEFVLSNQLWYGYVFVLALISDFVEVFKRFLLSYTSL